MSKEQTDLLPCPFCGAPGRVVDSHHPWNGEVWYAECSADCEMTPTCTKGSRAEAAAAWNRRASPSPAGGVQGVRIAELEAVLRGACDQILDSYRTWVADDCEAHPKPGQIPRYDAARAALTAALATPLTEGGERWPVT